MDNNKNLLLKKYANLIFEWNKKFNLTGLKTINDINEVLIDETLLSIANINFEFLNVKKIIDVGSGSGCPGILLAIEKPNIEVTIIESNKKKCKFLEIVKQELNIENVKIICSRVEELDHKIFTEKFDLGISRAVSSISIMNELLCRFIKINKFICHLKSLNFQKELNDAEKFLNELKLKFYNKIIVAQIPKFGINIFYQKIDQTPSKYPRRWKEIKK
ncbi:16S rRNA (guanine(527)-N(7))-methyltransferase RsmG [Mycoplasmoides pirum]|uniref:16S rRNA (guanine(527)-N(7))-methyltransferase RsmG n=1 Tax=Mycoplasmoides pirum TaxID=2122 RepID=UPI0004889195|nr:16S rRNA (guanine(527)-N(7))-methyltransferase RsmG [Mycoplasmoides pirum]